MTRVPEHRPCVRACRIVTQPGRQRTCILLVDSCPCQPAAWPQHAVPACRWSAADVYSGPGRLAASSTRLGKGPNLQTSMSAIPPVETEPRTNQTEAAEPEQSASASEVALRHRGGHPSRRTAFREFEAMELQQAFATGVVAVVGRSRLQAKPGSRWLRRVLLEGVFNLLSFLSRSPVASWKALPQQLLEISITYSV